MSKQKIHPLLKRVIWEVYRKKSGYEEIQLLLHEVEIDHIIPERVLLRPKELDEIEKWKENYDLENGFNIQGIENLCPSTRQFNLSKGDKGLYDEAGAYDRCIRKALKRAKELKPKIQEKYEKYKKESDLRKLNPRINTIKDIKRFVERSDIDSTFLIKSLNIPINKNELTDLEEYGNYNHILDKYRTSRNSFFNYGEYLEIKDSIRYSYNNELGEELFWIELIDEFIDNTSYNPLKKKLFYEKAFAIFKIGKSWIPIEIELLEYFESVGDEKNLEVLEQAVVLWGIFYGEFIRKIVKSSQSKVFEVKENLSNAINSNIAKSETYSRKTQLQFNKFFLKAIIIPNETIKEWIDRYIQNLSAFNSSLKIPIYFDIVNYYNNTVGGLSERLPNIEKLPKFSQLFEEINKLKDKYNGNNSSIRDLMERAIRMFDSGDYTKAIEQFQNIKMKALNPTKLYDCIFAHYYIGLCFEQMNLLYASKYYYLTAFFLSNENDTNYQTKQLAYKCGMDKWAAINFELGHTKEAIYSTLYSLMLRSYYSVEIIDFNDREDADNRNLNLLFTLIIQAYYYEKKFGSKEEFDYISNLLDKFGLSGIIERSIETLTTKAWDKVIDELKNMNYRIMLDTRKSRSYSWDQFGVNWAVEWDSYATYSFISDEFISYVQIILFCIRKMDISFINDVVPIRLLNSEETRYEGVIDGYHIVRITKCTSYNSYPHHIGKICSVLYEIISNSAIVSSDQFRQEMKEIMRKNYLSNSYQHLWVYSFGDDKFE